MEAPQVTLLGSSLLVPSVQELAKDPMNTLPPRYVHPGQEPPSNPTSTSAPIVQDLPVIDMQALFSAESMDSELARLDTACRDWGFFQFVNHGVSSSLLEKLKSKIHEFFNLPMEEKKKLWQKPGDMEGFGQGFVVSEDQKLDWADQFFIISLPTHLRKPHLFPKLPLPFRETLNAYTLEMNKLAMNILLQMTKSLKMKGEEMNEFFEDGMQGIRINFYPQCPQPELAIGLTPHSDAGGLTLLLQVNETDGLEINKQGTWIPVKPLPNAFIVNIADCLEIATNGAYRSILHRATVNSVKERLTIATFHGPKLDGEIGPAASLIGPNAPALFSRIAVKEYFKRFFSRQLDGKSNLELMRTHNGKDNDA
ncbi:PREDICTED: protein SRG1-like [Nelumbo nucifera]|uniref:Protein SRG1-like n=1 Tax=Nelumbo nucifera TaxID=4432 RepID=A0A1U8AX15_NELNU|nr:PREDICTED: protein SRG1-like [Nelumbo nucifera]